MFYSYLVLLIYVSETIYLPGNLPFFKIHVNLWPGVTHLLPLLPQCMLWVRGLVPFSEPLPFFPQQTASGCITSGQRSAGGTLTAPVWNLYQQLSVSLLYFNKIYDTKALRDQASSTGSGLNSSPLEAKNPGIFHGSAMTFQSFVIHIESSFQIEDAFHGIAIVSHSIVMAYPYMSSGYFSAIVYNFQCASLVILITSTAKYFINVDIVDREFFV